jgi:hypothetical protein
MTGIGSLSLAKWSSVDPLDHREAIEELLDPDAGIVSRRVLIGHGRDSVGIRVEGEDDRLLDLSSRPSG